MVGAVKVFIGNRNFHELLLDKLFQIGLAKKFINNICSNRRTQIMDYPRLLGRETCFSKTRNFTSGGSTGLNAPSALR